jgi:hypothetical protein
MKLTNKQAKIIVDLADRIRTGRHTYDEVVSAMQKGAPTTKDYEAAKKHLDETIAALNSFDKRD